VNILWLSHFIPYPPQGGLLQRSYNLLREAARQNDIYLLAFRQRALHPTHESVVEAVAELGKLCRHVEVVDIPWERWPLGWHVLVLYSLLSPQPYAVNWMRSRRMARRLRALLERVRIDLIHYDTIGLAHYLRVGGGVPKVLNHHNIESDMMLRRAAREASPLKRLYFSLEGRKLAAYERRNCGLFQQNLAVSSLDAEILRAQVPGLAVTDIPNGVDVDYFRPAGRQVKRHHLVFAGSLDWYPNIKAMDFFCQEVWPALKRSVPGVSLLIVGRNPSAEFARRCQAHEGVWVQGYVEDIRPYLEAAEVYVCPIRDSGGTKLKVLDALAMGKAIVAHPVACEGIEVVPGRDVLLAERPEEFVRQIMKIVEDDDLRDSLGRCGRALVEERYSYRYIGERLRAVYKWVAGHRACLDGAGDRSPAAVSGM
jgi:sugar transferase (PEP-CTERM/EpsH1 system associated)